MLLHLGSSAVSGTWVMFHPCQVPALLALSLNHLMVFLNICLANQSKYFWFPEGSIAANLSIWSHIGCGYLALTSSSLPSNKRFSTFSNISVVVCLIFIIINMLKNKKRILKPSFTTQIQLNLVF